MTPTDTGAFMVNVLMALAWRMFPKPGVAGAFLADFANDLDDMANKAPETPAKEAMKAAVAILLQSEGGAAGG